MKVRQKSAADFEIDIGHMLARPRVAELFRSGAAIPLTLVHAPSGYGKTTAALQFANGEKACWVYLCLNELDQDPRRFWTHLADLYEKLCPGIGVRMSQMGFPATTSQFMQLAEVLGDLSRKERHILILDDFHAADCQGISGFVSRMAALRIPGLHVLVLSRIKPQFFSIDLRVKGLLFEIVREDLRFDISEIVAYFKQGGMEIGGVGAARLSEYSEGWPSVVYLASRRSVKETGGGPFLPDFDIDRLIENTIYRGYDRETRDFLLKLSVLEKFDLEMCVYLTGRQNAYELLSIVTNENSLIKTAPDRRSFAMHSLFRDFLQERLRRQSVGAWRSLHRMAGEYYLYRGETLLALRHFDQAEDYGKMAEAIITNKCTGIFANQEFAGIIRYMEKIPQNLYRKHPMLSLILASAYILTRQGEKSVPLIAAVEERRRTSKMSAAMRNKLGGELCTLRVLLSFNRYDDMLNCCREALKLIPDGTDLISPDWSYTFGNPSVMYLFHNRAGGLDDAVRAFAEDFPVWERMSDLGYGADYLMFAEAAFERCDYESAERDAWRAIYRAQSKNQNCIVIAGRLLLVKICAAKGKYAAAKGLYADLRELTKIYNSTIFSSTIDMCDATFALLCGDPGGVPKWLAAGELDASGITGVGSGMEYLLYAHTLLAKRDYLRLEGALPGMFAAYVPFSNQYGVVRANLLAAITAYSLYGAEKALPYLNAAFAICEADRLIMPYLEYGGDLAPLLDLLADGYEEYSVSISRRAILDVRRRIGGHERALLAFRLGYRDEHPHAPGAGDVGLTRREKEILALIVKGMNGGEIARKLFVTPITIRVTTSKIYRKLGVGSRAGAVKKALEIGLTESR